MELPTATRLLDELRSRGLSARALGGIAVAIRCPTASTPAIRREFTDLDLIVHSRDAKALRETLREIGFDEQREFNTLNGHRRLAFDGAESEGHVDVFVGAFEMCHRLNLEGRLDVDPLTVPLADLALSKLQIAKLNQKDVVDIAAIFADHPLTDDDVGINQRYFVGLASRDWGWWRTVTENLELTRGQLGSLELAPEATSPASERIGALLANVTQSSKSLGWKARAKLGDRVPWRKEPEEGD